jgi:hypothetical protein
MKRLMTKSMLALYVVVLLVAASLINSVMLGVFTSFVAPSLLVYVPMVAFGIAVVGLFVRSKLPTALYAPALVTVFAKDIIDQIYIESDFHNNSVDDTSLVSGKSVVFPTAGTKPNVEIDRSVVPAQVSERTDSQNGYDLHEFTTDPILIKNSDGLYLNYDKRKSVLSQHVDTLREKMAFYFANLWGSTLAAQIVRTTGAGSALDLAPGATGTRKLITLSDLTRLKAKMTAQGIPMNGRIAFFHPNLLAEVMDIPQFSDASKYGMPTLPKGALGMIAGFAVMEAPMTPVYDNTGTPVKAALGAATTTADNLSAIFYHPDYVRRAKGEVEVLYKAKDPTYYGDVLSAIVYAGGRIKRDDEKGVITLVQAS